MNFIDMKYIKLSLFLLGILIFSSINVSAGQRVKIGDDFPKFFLKDIKGNNFFLNDYISDKATKKVKCILFSFYASYCKPCVKEVPEVEKLYEKYKSDGFEVYLINEGENAELAGKFVKEVGSNLPVLLDRYLVLNNLIGNPGVPHIVLIDNSGKVKFVSSGFGEKNSAELLKALENEITGLLGVNGGGTSQ